MDKSHYQIQTHRVLENQKIKIEYLTCFICKNVLWYPEQCALCNTHYCRFCIKFGLLKSKKCPCCLNDYLPMDGDTFLQEDLNELLVRCIYTYNGCNKAFKYEKLLTHEEECIYKEKNCEECNKKILKKDYHTHIIICKNSVNDCIDIDYNQIVIYFQDKLAKIEKENLEDIDKVKKNFLDIFQQKENVLNGLLQKMEKQQKLLEDIIKEREKTGTLREEELKSANNNCKVI